MKLKNSIAKQKVLLLLTTSLLAAGVVSAQFSAGGPGTNGANGSGPTNDLGGSPTSPSVPFDGGMSLVLAASGIGYAAKKLKKKK